MTDDLKAIRAEIAGDPHSSEFTRHGYEPLFSASPRSRVVIVGQAPGRKAQESGIPWDDPSGLKLRNWLGVTDEQFYDPDLIALLPMDFYYPGKAKNGDRPPRKEFAPKWHPRILAEMTDLRLTVVVGAYALTHCLGKNAKRNLTETVRSYRDYTPESIPLVHPSPLNFRWQAKNPWFDEKVIPELRRLVADALA